MTNTQRKTYTLTLGYYKIWYSEAFPKKQPYTYPQIQRHIGTQLFEVTLVYSDKRQPMFQCPVATVILADHLPCPLKYQHFYQTTRQQTAKLSSNNHSHVKKTQISTHEWFSRLQQEHSIQKITVTFNTRLKYKKPSHLVHAKHNEGSFLHYVHNNYFISRWY
jgi:hypothetical protein